MFDRSNYLPRTISVYQIVGAYLVDIYYNHLYVEAQKYKSKGDVPTITEGYRHATFAFLSGLDHHAKASYKAQHYKQLLIGINEYFKTWTSFNTLTVSDCIEKIVREFVPDDYFKSLDKDQKTDVLRMVLTGALREFTKVVVEEFLHPIIDNHDDEANIEALKERVIDIFIAERERMFHKFLASHFPASDEVVDKKFAERMREEINKLNTEKSELLQVVNKQQEELDVRKDQLAKVVARYRKLEGAYKRVVEECKLGRDSIATLEAQIQEVESQPRPKLDLGESEFMGDTGDDTDATKEAMDKLIAAHTVTKTAAARPTVSKQGGSAPTVSKPTAARPTVSKQVSTVSKPAVKPPAKPVPVVKSKPKPEPKQEPKPESESEEEEESEEEPEETEETEKLPAKTKQQPDKPEPMKIITKTAAKITNTPAPASIASIADEAPKSPKAKSDTGNASSLLADY
jgi:outer membrane biosynthesis protein TonB